MNSDQQEDWRVSYRAALLEVDPARLPERIEIAFETIQKRMDVMRQNQNWNPAEHQDLADALANLRVLQREIPPSNPNRKETRVRASNP